MLHQPTQLRALQPVGYAKSQEVQPEHAEMCHQRHQHVQQHQEEDQGKTRSIIPYKSFYS